MNAYLREIPLEMIEIGDNVRTIRDPSQDTALAANIRENGVLQPVCVTPIASSDRYLLVFGSRRLLGQRDAGQKTVIAMVLPEAPTSDEATIRQLSENSARVPLHPADLVAAIAGLVAAGWTGAAIAKRLGEHESTVSRWITVAKHATPEILSRIRAGTLCMSGACELCKLPEESRSVVLADQPESQRLTRDALVRKIKRVQRRQHSGTAAATPSKIVARVGRAQTVTFAGRDMSLQALVQWLGELLARATRAQAQGMDIAGFALALKRPPTTPDGAAP